MAEAPFKCPHCATEYEVAYNVGPLETDSRNCDNCGNIMDSWTDARRPVYMRTQARTDDDNKTS